MVYSTYGIHCHLISLIILKMFCTLQAFRLSMEQSAKSPCSVAHSKPDRESTTTDLPVGGYF